MRTFLFCNACIIGFFYLVQKPTIAIIFAVIFIIALMVFLYFTIKNYREYKRLVANLSAAIEIVKDIENRPFTGSLAKVVITCFELSYSSYRASGFLFHYKYIPMFVDVNLVSNISNNLRETGYKQAITFGLWSKKEIPVFRYLFLVK